jgi:hypothetical protein
VNKTILNHCLLGSCSTLVEPLETLPEGLEIVPISKALIHQHVAFTPTRALLALYKTLRNDAKGCRINTFNLKLRLITH